MRECVSEDMQVCNWSLDDSVYEEDVCDDEREYYAIDCSDYESVTTKYILLLFC